MMAQIDKNTKLSISLVVVFFVLAVVLSLGASAVITRPLHRVSLCLNSISCLDMDKAKEWGRSRSVRELFNFNFNFNFYFNFYFYCLFLDGGWFLLFFFA